MVAVLVTQPMDVIKTKLSTQNWLNSTFCCKKIENCKADGEIYTNLNKNNGYVNKMKIDNKNIKKIDKNIDMS